MAQVLAVPGDVRHGFSYILTFNHDFGRITGISATTKGNILLCDCNNKNVILFDPKGIYLNMINLDSEPFDVAITSQNIGYITLPSTRTVLEIDPDRMVVMHKQTEKDDLCTAVMCVSAVPNSGREISSKVPCYLGARTDTYFLAYPVHNDNINIKNPENCFGLDLHVIKFHAFDTDTFFSCIGGQNYIKQYKFTRLYNIMRIPTKEEHIIKIETMDTPTDVCSDDNGHIYVSGQGSNNIHRLTRDGKVLDIPLDIRHGIMQPVALCFNQNYDKLYIVNQWGKRVMVFDVI